MTNKKSPIRDMSQDGSVDPRDHIGHKLYVDAFGVDFHKRHVVGNAYCSDCIWQVAAEITGPMVLTETDLRNARELQAADASGGAKTK